MITTKDGQDPRILEEMFYAKPFAFSYSSLNKLLHSPGLFYRHYILGERDDEMEASMVEGRVVHALLLDQDAFDENFIIAQTKLPSDNVRDVIERVFELYISEDKKKKHLDEFSTEILDILKEKNFYQSIKKDEDRLAKIMTLEAHDYFTFLKESTGKTIINYSTYEKCVDTVSKLKDHDCMRILGMKDNDNLDHVYNELMVELDSQFAQFPFGLKGMIDNLFIDKANKKVRINDLKTTNRTVTDFPETVMFYNYWMQAAIYMRLGRSLVQNLHDDYKDFDMVFSFVVIDKYSQIYVFEVSEETMTNWEIDLQEKLNEAKYHYEKRDYTLPYKFVTSQVRL